MKPNEIITARILEALEKGTAPWHRPWTAQGMRNVVSNKCYRGINIFVLSYFGNDNYFLTYNQAKSLGGNVKKGAKGLPVTFYKRVESSKHFDKNGKAKLVPLLRYFIVFAVSDCEGLNWTRPETNRIAFEPIACAQGLIERFLPLMGYTLEHGGDEAYHVGSTKRLRLPYRETFLSVPHYYATAFHEIGHGMHSVTSDTVGNTFGNEPYSKEELTAEIFSSFCLNHCNLLEPNLFNNSTAYLRHWKAKLTEDASLVISAASKAQRRFEALLGITYHTKDCYIETRA